MKIFFGCISLLMQFGCYCQTYPPQDFAEIPLPKTRDAVWYTLSNGSGKAFSVAVVSGKLQVSKSNYSSSVHYTLPGGDLLGIDMGEFGGGLYYKPNDSTIKNFYYNGKQATIHNDPFSFGLAVPKDNPVTKMVKDRILVKNGNIKFIFLYRDTTYFLEGLAHMGLNFGALYKLKIQHDSITGSKVTDFTDAPMAMTICNDNILIATNESFYVLHNYDKEVIFKDLFWDGLYPNSVACIDNENIYVGMRGGYAKINLPQKKLKFYKYSK